MIAARVPLQNAVLRDLFTSELLRSLNLESAQPLLKGWRPAGRVTALRTSDLFEKELFVPSRSLNLELASKRVCRQAALFVIAGRFTNELVGRGRWLSLDSLQSLLTGGRVLRQAAVLVVTCRFTSELFTRGCIRVVAGIGWRNRAFENAGWRWRAGENVRCGTTCRTALWLRYPEYVVVLCGAFLWLYGICASAVSVIAKLPMQIKRLRLIISPVLRLR